MTRSPRGTRPPRGFTLVEALVAIAILGLVAVLAWRATAAMTDNEVRLAAETARWQQLDALLTRVEADLRAAVPRPARHGAIDGRAPGRSRPTTLPGNALLIFTRAGPTAVESRVPAASASATGGATAASKCCIGRISTMPSPRCRRAIRSASTWPAFASARSRPTIAGPTDGHTGQRRHSAWRSHRARAGRRQVVERWLALQ